MNEDTGVGIRKGEEERDGMEVQKLEYWVEDGEEL